MNYRELQLRQIIKRDYVPKKELTELKVEHQGQLRAINLLFDAKVGSYERIDFNGLYSLLKQIAERERERERAKPTQIIITKTLMKKKE